MKFEEVLPAFRDGKEVRRASWANKDFTLSFDDLDNSYPHSLYFNDIFADDWEIIEEPEPDWQYIIDHKCLCRFWDDEEVKVFGYLCRFPESKDYYLYKTQTHDGFKYFKNCRPVRKNELNFYEDKEDEDNS